jgi:hypothetical protein
MFLLCIGMHGGNAAIQTAFRFPGRICAELAASRNATSTTGTFGTENPPSLSFREGWWLRGVGVAG